MNKQILINRLKSLAWRLGMMVLAVFVTFLAENLELFNLSGELTILLGLILGEISKWLNVDVRASKV